MSTVSVGVVPGTSTNTKGESSGSLMISAEIF